ncbi:MAG TPA: helix-turn-helix transcriptional regulator [Planctomycetaceae bacterium]|jgi:hypothetical protein
MKASKHLAFGHKVFVEGKKQYLLARKTAKAEQKPPAALPYLVASFYAGPDDRGCPHALDELQRWFSLLAFEIAERVTKSPTERLDLIAEMLVDLGRTLVACRKKKRPADRLEAHLRCELGYSPQHLAEAEPFVIRDSHHGEDRQELCCRQSVRDPFCNRPPRDLREGRGLWRKPRAKKMQTTPDERERERERNCERERGRMKSGWYERYIKTAEAALRLTLTPSEREIVLLAASGNSPEEICRMLKYPPDYVQTIVRSLEAWTQ